MEQKFIGFAAFVFALAFFFSTQVDESVAPSDFSSPPIFDNIGGKAYVGSSSYYDTSSSCSDSFVSDPSGPSGNCDLRDSDQDGDPDISDCSPFNSQILSPRDDLKVTGSMMLCPGTYSLQDEGEKGVIIIKDQHDSILDCQNAIINGDQVGVGLLIEDTKNSVIKNCVFQSFNRNLAGSDSTSNIFEENIFNVSLNDNFLLGYSENIFRGNTFSGSKNHGLHMHANLGLEYPYDFSYKNMFEQNYFYNNDAAGLHLNDSREGLIKNNIIYGNEIGIDVAASERIKIINNSVTDNVVGVYLKEARINENDISHNYICKNVIDLECGYKSQNIGNYNFMGSVNSCSDGWPVQGKNYVLCMNS